MKRITVVFLMMILVCQAVCITSVNAGDFGVPGAYWQAADALRVLGVIDKNSVDFDAEVSNAQFAGFAARLSGYETGTAGMPEDGPSDPDKTVTYGEAVKIISDLLGYGVVAGTKGGYPYGYLSVAQQEGLLRGINLRLDDPMSYGQAFQLMYNALDAKVMEPSVFSAGGGIKYKKDETLMRKYLGVSTYRVFVNGINTRENTITAKIQSGNNFVYNTGDTATFNVSGNIDVIKINRVQLDIWVDKNETVINTILPTGTDILYTYINAVNKDDEAENEYDAGYIDTVGFIGYDKHMRLSENAEIYHNDKVISGSVKLVNNFARVVVADDEVSVIQTWDLTLGGVTTAVNKGVITYTQGVRNGLMLKTADFGETVVFVDAGRAVVKDLTADMLLDYYIDEISNRLMICASSQKITDTLYSAGDNEFEIGKLSYKKDEISCYYSEDGVRYYGGGNGIDLINSDVVAYLDGKGAVRYIKKAVGAESGLTEFYGVLIGVQRDSVLKMPKVRLACVAEKGIDIRDYELHRKVRLNDGITVDEIAANAKNLEGKGVYYFKINNGNEIIEVNRAAKFDSISNTIFRPTIFPAGNKPYVQTVPKNGGGVYDVFRLDGARYIGIYEYEGEFIVEEYMWSDLANKSCADVVTMDIYAKEETSDVELAVLTGSLENIYVTQTLNFGLITNKRRAVDAAGAEYYKVEMQAGAATSVRDVGAVNGKDLPQNAFVVYNSGVITRGSDIHFAAVLDITAPLAEVPTEDSRGMLISQRVQRIDGDKRIIFEDGRDYFIDPNTFWVYGVQRRGGKNVFFPGSLGDVKAGDHVLAVAHWGSLKCVFYSE